MGDTFFVCGNISVRETALLCFCNDKEIFLLVVSPRCEAIIIYCAPYFLIYFVVVAMRKPMASFSGDGNNLILGELLSPPPSSRFKHFIPNWIKLGPNKSSLFFLFPTTKCIFWMGNDGTDSNEKFSPVPSAPLVFIYFGWCSLWIKEMRAPLYDIGNPIVLLTWFINQKASQLLIRLDLFLRRIQLKTNADSFPLRHHIITNVVVNFKIITHVVKRKGKLYRAALHYR